MKFTLAALAALLLTGFAAEASGIGADPSMVRASKCSWLCEFPVNVRGEPAVIMIDNQGEVTRTYATGQTVDDTVIIRGPGWTDPVEHYDFTIRREGDSYFGLD